ncbi:hypothetical protein EYF80_012617 [Liparis tanakae]|uniref:Uncharacterized protein n=1 Tax=Liparis tanakae TaxID=230148 RepID=A0A4Z2IH29_9TELE|nr:hypothetical protein EYF80_012617 [Liparis tanakae]
MEVTTVLIVRRIVSLRVRRDSERKRRAEVADVPDQRQPVRTQFDLISWAAGPDLGQSRARAGPGAHLTSGAPGLGRDTVDRVPRLPG